MTIDYLEQLSKSVYVEPESCAVRGTLRCKMKRHICRV